MSLKNLLIKNSFTYKIYIYYNLYIRHKAHKIRRQYSQWGEDLVIENWVMGNFVMANFVLTHLNID